MKTIIKNIVENEIKNILENSRDTISEIVKETLIPEIHKIIWAELKKELNVIAKKNEPIKDKGLNQSIKSFSKAPTPHLDDDDHDHHDDGKYIYCIVKGEENLNFGKIGIKKEDVYTICIKI
jgi:hypothetical protein